eukprot:maker-scaffold1482_size38982-snap-gene-0.9 protein:Tk05076 transcript:maker-scaffold1482_size38982-snap-gene-0.9-mRNA-1 annotation:"PREDICTED: bestrophin-1-like"
MADSQYTPEPKVPEMGAFPMTKTNIYANRYKDTNKRFRGFWHLMAMWKGSVLKLIWHDMLVFLVLYSALSLTYRFWLFDNPKHRQAFELVCVYASRFRGMIPITFLTGFYVSQVVSRYWDQFMTLPFTDQLAYKVVTFIPGDDVYKRNLRRTVMRYVNLSIVLVYRLVSSKVRDRFSTFDELVRSRLLLPEEKDRLQQADKETPFELTWVPILWALRLIQDARTKGRINIEPPIFASLVGQFDKIDTSNRKILNYGWVNFPLAYTQVATISVFAYFFASLFACQYLIPESKTMDTETFPNLNISFSVSKPFELHTPDIFVPVFTIVEFISYMGWIKVAEALLNPFGDDDDDFQINYLIDRNLFISYMIVDQGGYDFPDVKDPFLADNVPPELPYNDDSLMDDSSKLITTTVEDQVEPVETGIIGRVRRKLSTASFARIAPGNRSTSSHSTMSVHSNLGPGSSAEPKLSRANSGAVVDHDQDIEIGALGSNNHLQVPRKSVRRKSAPKPDMEVMADAQDDMNSVSKLMLTKEQTTFSAMDRHSDGKVRTLTIGGTSILTSGPKAASGPLLATVISIGRTPGLVQADIATALRTAGCNRLTVAHRGLSSELAGDILLSWPLMEDLGLLSSRVPCHGSLVVREDEDSIDKIKADFKDVLGDSLEKAAGGMTGEKMKIQLRENVNVHDIEKAIALLEELVRDKIIVPVTIPTKWCAIAHFIRKPAGRLWLVADYRKLNKYVCRPVHPFVPAVEVAKQVHADALIFAKLDAVHGYFQVPLDESSYLTTFLTLWGRFRHASAPMGLSSSSDEFNVRSDRAVGREVWLLKIIDDLLVQGATVAEVLARLWIICLFVCLEGPRYDQYSTITSQLEISKET